MGQRRDRSWQEDIRLVDQQSNVVGADRDQAKQAFLELEAILAREGGAITIMPIRVEMTPPGSLTGKPEMVNLGYIFEHHFAPTAGRVEQAPSSGNGTQAPDPMPERTVEDFAPEPAAVMPRPVDPADQHTEPRASDLPEPAPLRPEQLVPETR